MFLMAIHSIKAVQRLPVGKDEAWAFFSDPGNLAAITPAALDFRVTSKYHGEEVYAGQIITYVVKPLWGIPLRWATEITHMEVGRYFVDEQRFGPYALWHHQHHFSPVMGGTEMVDIVHYKLPFGVLGGVALPLVRKKLREIFEFRFFKTEALLGKWPEKQSPALILL